MKRLYKSNTDKVIAGVCGGVAKYLGIDSTLVRVVFVISVLIGGIGIFGYIIAIIIIPSEPKSSNPQNTSDVFEEDKDFKLNENSAFESFSKIDLNPLKKNIPLIIGGVFILIGLMILLSTFGIIKFHTIAKFIWPAIIITVGVIILVNSKK